MSPRQLLRPEVTPDDDGIRPAGPPDRCCYCKQRVGELHLESCVIVRRRVRIRAIIEYEVEVPQTWDKSQIEFHRNDGSWCADNMIEELRETISEDHCLCSHVVFEYVDEGEVT